MGKSSSGLNRPYQHARSYHHKYNKYKATLIEELKSAGLSFSVVVLEEVPDPRKPLKLCWWASNRNTLTLNELERWWIAYGYASGWPLTNQLGGSSGILNYSMPLETRQKISKAHLGKRLSHSQIEIMRINGSRPEMIAKSTEILIGYKASLTKKQLSEVSRKGGLASRDKTIARNKEGKGKTLNEFTKIKIGKGVSAFWSVESNKEKHPSKNPEMREAQSLRMTAYWAEHKHHCGTVAAYSRGCRCTDCRAAGSEYSKILRSKPRPCGTLSGYHHGCRCELCKESKRLHRIKNNETAKQRSRRANKVLK